MLYSNKMCLILLRKEELRLGSLLQLCCMDCMPLQCTMFVTIRLPYKYFNMVLHTGDVSSIQITKLLIVLSFGFYAVKFEPSAFDHKAQLAVAAYSRQLVKGTVLTL